MRPGAACGRVGAATWQIPISSPKMPTLLDPDPPSTQRLLSRRNDQPDRTPLALLSRARLDGTCIPVRTESLDTGPHDFTFSVGAITMLRGEGAKVLGHNVDSHGYVKDQYRALDFGLGGFSMPAEDEGEEREVSHLGVGLGCVAQANVGYEEGEIRFRFRFRFRLFPDLRQLPTGGTP